MLASVIAYYLVSEGKITKPTYEALKEELTKVRVKLGLIAVHEGLMTEEQANTVNVLQSSMNKRFGDIAVEKGYLTESQVGELLSKQGNPYLSLAQALENLKIMGASELENLLAEYKLAQGLTDDELEALKEDDIDKIILSYIPEGYDQYKDIVSVAIKTILRVVDNGIVPLKGTAETKIRVNKVAAQFVDGDPCLSTSFNADDDGLLYMASVFGQEEFSCVNEDALDAVAELINCVNGMYASMESEKGIRMELYPPEFSTEVLEIRSVPFVNIPAIVGGSKVNLSFCIGEKLDLF